MSDITSTASNQEQRDIALFDRIAENYGRKDLSGSSRVARRQRLLRRSRSGPPLARTKLATTCTRDARAALSRTGTGDIAHAPFRPAARAASAARASRKGDRRRRRPRCASRSSYALVSDGRTEWTAARTSCQISSKHERPRRGCYGRRP